MSAAHDPVPTDWPDLPVTAGVPNPEAQAESALDTLESLTAPAAPMLVSSVSARPLPEVTVPDLPVSVSVPGPMFRQAHSS